METNSKAVKAIYTEHCWRNGGAVKAANKKASKDMSGLDPEQRRRIEDIKQSKDHPVDDDPLFNVEER